MAKFYIVAKENDNFNLIKINTGNYLEEIDIFTSHFKDKEDFVNYLREEGYNISPEADLYVVNKGRREIYHRDLIYNNSDLEFIANKSRNGSVDVTNTCNKLLYKVQTNLELQRLIRRNYFDLYGTLKELILSSLSSNYVRIGKNRNWMRNNYFVGRDALATIDIFDNKLNKMVNKDCEEVIREQKELQKSRREVDHLLTKKINYTNEQMSLLDNQVSYINLTYANLDKILDKTPKKVVRAKKMGIMNNRLADKLTIPYDIITEDIDYRFITNVASCVLNLPYKIVKWGSKERYEIDFDKVTNETGIEYNDADRKFLNSLLDGRLRKNAYWKNYYRDMSHRSSSVKREENSYERTIYTTLMNAAKNKTDLYKKAYNFYLIHSNMLEAKNNERGGYGR